MTDPEVPCAEAGGVRATGAQLNFFSVREKCGRQRWRRGASDPGRAVKGSRVEAAEREVWANFLSRLRDPRLYVQETLS